MSFENESFKVKFSDSESFKVKIKDKQNNAINVTELDSGPVGPKGKDGFSPTVDVTVEDNTPIVTVTDVRGTTVTEFPRIPNKTSDLINDVGYITEADVPTKTSDLENDSGFITASDIPVTSVNGKTGDVVLNASDIITAGNGISIENNVVSVTDLILDCGSSSRVIFNG